MSENTLWKSEPSSPTILLVDDVPANIQMLASALVDDYEIMVATNGLEALQIVRDRPPDLILLDVMMPEMDGHEVCRRLKENPNTCKIPVIFITGKNDEGDEVEGLQLGAVDYITKPFSLPIVQARVRTHLELKRYRDMLENLSFLDGLTGLPNRRRFTEFLDIAWGQAQRQRSPIASILMDVDHFKTYNDNYGHQAGDECLIRVGQALACAERRSSSLVARYGGEEFICVLPGMNAQQAMEVADRLRSSVDVLGIPHAFSSAADHVTISLGLASMVPSEDLSILSLVECADKALYQAKDLGRNRTFAWELSQ